MKQDIKLVAGFVATLNAAAERQTEMAETVVGAQCRAHIKAAVALAGLADQFEAGDFDAEFMSRYQAMMEDGDQRDAVIEASAKATARVGFEPGFIHPDDLLDTILREASGTVPA